MILAKIVGTVVATRKDDRLVSSKLLVARPMDPRGKPEGSYLVAVDTVDAGVGETVLIVSGSSARMASGLKDCPVDAAIVGIIDTIEVKDSGSQTRRCSSRASSAKSSRRSRTPNLTATKLLVLQPLAASGEPAGRTLVALDSVGAGVGENVFFVRGREAAFPFYPAEPPTDATIVGIVDHWHTEAEHGSATPIRLEPDANRRVVGTVVSTQKNRKLEGAKLLLVQPLTLDDAPRGVALHRDRFGRRRRRREGARGHRGQGRRRCARQEGRGRRRRGDRHRRRGDLPAGSD